MKRLIIHGDPGIRKNAIIDYDDEEQVCFSVTRQGDWHGPDEPQLWCVIGVEEERGDFERRKYIPHWLDTETIDAGAVEVVKHADELAVE